MLSLVFVVAFAFGCNGGGSSAGVFEIKETDAYEGGLHVFEKEDTGRKIIENGSTKYKLVLNENAKSKRGILTKTDFCDLFREATGLSLEVVYSSAIVDTWTENDKYIVLGCTDLEEKAGLTLNDQYVPEGKTINLQGFQIRTKGNNVFVMGRNQTAVLWGAYELLTQLFNYERYWVDFYEIDKNVTDLALYDYKISDNPDLETRIGTFGAVYAAAELVPAARMRFVLQHQDVYIGATRFHNTLEWLPPETYYDAHQSWYAQKNVGTPVPLVNVFQLCYTAGGIAEEYELMVNTMAQSVIADLEKNTTLPVVTITQEDNTRYCNCSACEAGNVKYGRNLSGNMWKFHLDVVEVINNWLDANQPGRKDTLLIAMYAYQTYTQAPAYQDEKGEWHPYGEEVNGFNPDRNIANAAIQYAISGADYVHGIHREEYNKHVATAIDGWSVCCRNVGAWTYQTDFHDYLIPTDTFNYQNQYRILAEFGTKWIFDQGQQGNKNSSGFNDFKLYLNSKLQWNCNLDVEELTVNYFNAMYGPAAQTMREYHEHMRLHMQTVKATDIDGALASAQNYPYGTTRQWLEFVDKAYADLEAVKDTLDPVLYQAYKDHICTESIVARYIMITWYPDSVSPEQLQKDKRSFKEDVLRLNFTESVQHININDLVKDW